MSHVLDATITVDQGALHLDVDLGVADGEVLALVGPNGAGKTTMLRVLAGLQAARDGRVVLEGTVVDDAAAGIFVPAEQRRVGMVFQDHLLFPHLSLLENVAFGPRARGQEREEARRLAATWLERMGIGESAESRPGMVSGGQAQRAALARALVTDPALLLLDEPLSALDVTARAVLRRDLRSHLAGFGGATVLVTHDALDVFALADRVAILEAGTVTQQGTLAELTGTPRTPYAAELMGTNLLSGIARGTEVAIGDERGPHAATVVVAEAHHGPVLVLVRPSSVTLHREAPTGSMRNRWSGVIRGFDLLGERVRVHLDGAVPLVAEVTPRAIAELALVEGDTVWAAVKATDLVVVDR